jgi:hypothetical protein
MPDTYLSISRIAGDSFMNARVRACATQQAHLGVPIDDPLAWTGENAYLWAASPGWAEKWDYALETHDNPAYQPGEDPAVITDADILSTVQALTAETP